MPYSGFRQGVNYDPLGLGLASPLRVKYNARACRHAGNCREACRLSRPYEGASVLRVPVVWVEDGPTHSLTDEIKGLSKIL